jgi:hypothetical protein
MTSWTRGLGAWIGLECPWEPLEGSWTLGWRESEIVGMVVVGVLAPLSLGGKGMVSLVCLYIACGRVSCLVVVSLE